MRRKVHVISVTYYDEPAFMFITYSKRIFDQFGHLLSFEQYCQSGDAPSELLPSTSSAAYRGDGAQPVWGCCPLLRRQRIGLTGRTPSVDAGVYLAYQTHKHRG